MKELIKNIAALTEAPGPTGDERGVGEAVQALFSRYCGDVWRDNALNVFARAGSGRPLVLIMAHMDEIGLMVRDVEKDGLLRLVSIAGVDPRVLPGSAVVVHGKEDLPAVVGAAPPHLLGEDAKAAYKIEDLLCDAGLPPERVRALVRPGDTVTLAPEAPLELLNSRVSCKTLDDRALVAVEAELLKAFIQSPPPCTVVLCASAQEEKSGYGAIAAAWALEPDIAIALDVTHGDHPDIKKPDGTDMEALSLSRGGNVHPALYKKLAALCRELDVPYQTDARLGKTGTDGADLQISRRGVPTAVVSVPLRYMHTSVECLSLKTLSNCARLMEAFVRSAGEVKLCWDA